MHMCVCVCVCGAQEAHGHAQRGDLEPEGGRGEVDAPTFAFRALLTEGMRILKLVRSEFLKLVRSEKQDRVSKLDPEAGSSGPYPLGSHGPSFLLSPSAAEPQTRLSRLVTLTQNGEVRNLNIEWIGS